MLQPDLKKLGSIIVKILGIFFHVFLFCLLGIVFGDGFSDHDVLWVYPTNYEAICTHLAIEY